MVWKSGCESCTHIFRVSLSTLWDRPVSAWLNRLASPHKYWWMVCINGKHWYFVVSLLKALVPSMLHPADWVNLFIKYNTLRPISTVVKRLFSIDSEVIKPKQSSLTSIELWCVRVYWTVVTKLPNVNHRRSRSTGLMATKD